MTFWALAGLMIVIALAFILYPLLRGGKAASDRRQDHDISVYKDQLAEVTRDLERGVISESEAGAARVEIERRLLKAAESMEDIATGPGGGATSKLAALILCLALPATAFLTYDFLGAPGLPGEPFAARQDQPSGAAQDQAVAQLKTRLEQDPHDLDAWLLLGNLYARLGRWTEAAGAYGDALQLDGQNAEALIGRAESMVALAQGLVVPEARQLFAQVLEQDPRQPSALYYAGLALAQDGLLENAQEVWSSLLAAAPEGAPWVPLVTQQLARLAAQIEQQGGTGGEPAPLAGQEPGPSQADVEAASELTPEERQDFIRSMVQRLADRLAENPDDLEGWLRLARSYRVLGEEAQAEEALTTAESLVEDFPADAPERALIAAARQEFAADN